MKYTLGILLVATTLVSTNAAANDFVKPIQNTKIQYSYSEILPEAIFHCPFSRGSAVDNIELVEALARIEKEYDLPHDLRGMLMAAACHESGYNPLARGDHRFSKVKKAKAIGLFQMWPWWEKYYKIDRTDPLASARAYMEHIKKSLKKIKKQCRYKNERKAWLAAWATAIRTPKKTGRCGERPKFYRILNRWHNSIEEERKLIREYEQSVPGC